MFQEVHVAEKNDSEGGGEESSSLRKATNELPDKRVSMPIYVRASCVELGAGAANTENLCTVQMLQELMTTKGNNNFAPTLLMALQAGGPVNANSDYFSSVTRIVFGDELVDFDPPLVSPAYGPDISTQSNEVPAWVWIVLAIDVLILLCAGAWVAYRQYYRRRMVEENRRVRKEEEGEKKLSQLATNIQRGALPPPDEAGREMPPASERSSSNRGDGAMLDRDSNRSSISRPTPEDPLDLHSQQVPATATGRPPLTHQPKSAPRCRNVLPQPSDSSYDPEEAPTPQY